MTPFLPDRLPRDDLDWAELAPLIARANRAITRYDGVVQDLVDSSVLLSPLSAREAHSHGQRRSTVRLTGVRR